MRNAPGHQLQRFDKSDYKFQDGGQNGAVLQLAVTQSFINIETSFFFPDLCVMTPDISCRSLIQIGL